MTQEETKLLEQARARGRELVNAVVADLKKGGHKVGLKPHWSGDGTNYIDSIDGGSVEARVEPSRSGSAYFKVYDGKLRLVYRTPGRQLNKAEPKGGFVVAKVVDDLTAAAAAMKEKSDSDNHDHDIREAGWKRLRKVPKPLAPIVWGPIAKKDGTFSLELDGLTIEQVEAVSAALRGAGAMQTTAGAAGGEGK